MDGLLSVDGSSSASGIGVLIKCYEMSPLDSVGHPCVYDLSIVIEGNGISIPSEDESHLKQAIESHPYPSLRSRQMVKAKQDTARAAKMKAIEELGCPTQGTTFTSGQPTPIPEGVIKVIKEGPTKLI